VSSARFSGRGVVRALAASCVVALVGSVALLSPACSDAVSHVYTGRSYDPARDCLGETTTIDVVKGADSSFACDAVCMFASGEGGGAYYISNECPPFPLFFSVNPPDATCAKALAAAARGDACFGDGGSANPAHDDAAAPSDASDAPSG
jgi:hypothetical protein